MFANLKPRVLIVDDEPQMRSALVAALDLKNLDARKTEAEAVPNRVTNALNKAAQLLEPKVQFVPVEKIVLRSEGDVDNWLAGQRTKLLDALKVGPVQVQWHLTGEPNAGGDRPDPAEGDHQPRRALHMESPAHRGGIGKPSRNRL